ncbi:MAG: hypothetical protein COA96_04335 [SAR86 cluster bacterium]|uniref:DUF1456 domain-containing protein n=1 Tax=SAR86 cluster bacterium TaxID=2030880 RepID=A0A2A5B5U2_9GAMM|nr:MAG: hypothetical protein COA96_04335 [SAR86 cluster bacterium]
MTNNDCLRRIRYILSFDDSAMINTFAHVDQQVSREQLCTLLKKDDDPDFEECSDTLLAAFLNGLIIEKRGKREGEQPQPEKRLNNNMIFIKLRIAFGLKAEDILSLFSLVDFRISKHELSAFFRKPKTRQYRACKDQILRNFLSALQSKYHKNDEAEVLYKGKAG